MKHTKVIMAAAITVALGAGIIVSCAKEHQNAKTEQTASTERFGNGNSAWYGCMLLCYSDLNIAYLIAYEELLQEYLYDLNH